MSNFAISGAGAAIGGWLGGPYGAALGWMLGSYLSADPDDIKQGQIGDLRIQTSQYGTNIPIVFGKQRVAGNVIWANEKTTYEIREPTGGKGGGPDVVTIGYKMTMAIAICQGPIDGISRVWADGKLIIDGSAAAVPSIGTLYVGDDSQLPDPVMESFLGAGNVPGYRGLAYYVLHDFDLGQTGRIPNFSFEVLKSSV